MSEFCVICILHVSSHRWKLEPSLVGCEISIAIHLKHEIILWSLEEKVNAVDVVDDFLCTNWNE